MTRGAGQPHFLPCFAQRGYPSYALSLRGHGASGGRETLFVAGLDDYAADVERVAADLAGAPVLIGHSMGAAVVERLLGTRAGARGGAARAGPAGGPADDGGAAGHRESRLPDAAVAASTRSRLTSHVLDTLRPFYFSRDVDPGILAEAALHLASSRRAR